MILFLLFYLVCLITSCDWLLAVCCFPPKSPPWCVMAPRLNKLWQEYFCLWIKFLWYHSFISFYITEFGFLYIVCLALDMVFQYDRVYTSLCNGSGGYPRASSGLKYRIFAWGSPWPGSDTIDISHFWHLYNRNCIYYWHCTLHHYVTPPRNNHYCYTVENNNTVMVYNGYQTRLLWIESSDFSIPPPPTASLDLCSIMLPQIV